MKSEWSVMRNRALYQVYRLYDVQKIREDWNIEWHGFVFKNKAEAEAFAAKLNKKDAGI